MSMCFFFREFVDEKFTFQKFRVDLSVQCCFYWVFPSFVNVLGRLCCFVNVVVNRILCCLVYAVLPYKCFPGCRKGVLL